MDQNQKPEDYVGLNISGIKCDNSECDYRDDDVKMRDYPDWLNRPCPKCGENLLTQEDLDQCNMLVGIAGSINVAIDNSSDEVKAMAKTDDIPFKVPFISATKGKTNDQL